jgi:hypothetical protein
LCCGTNILELNVSQTQPFINKCVTEFFLNNPSGRTMVLGLTQLLTKESTRSISWDVKEAGA